RIAGDALSGAISGADIVICRSGYSTLMDLVKLDKQAILIPTPGQTEQEYLAKELYRQNLFVSATQRSFHLANALGEAGNFPFGEVQFENAFEIFRPAVDGWLNEVQQSR